MENQNIAKAIKKFEIVLLVIVVFEFLGLYGIKLVAGNVLKDSQNQQSEIFLNAFLIIMLIACIAGDLSYIKLHILDMKSLLHVKPTICVVEDYVVFRYKNGKDTSYDTMLLVRNPENDKLFFTYGKYNMSFYTSVRINSGLNIKSVCVYRKDKSEVEIGDKVKLYIKKPVSVDVKVDMEDSDKKIVVLNKYRYRYYNLNEDYDVNVFNRVNFVQAVVDVEM